MTTYRTRSKFCLYTQTAGMDMDDNYVSDTAQLLGSSVAHRGKKGKGRKDGASNGQAMMVLSEPEKLQSDDGFAQSLKRIKGPSGSLGDSLPSVRAQLAANAHTESKQLHKRTSKETTPLLGANSAHQEKGGGSSDSFELSGSNYHAVKSVSLPHSGKPKKGFKATAKRGYTIAKVTTLTLFLLVSIILFSINDEHDDFYYYVGLGPDKAQPHMPISYTKENISHWKFVTVKVHGPFLDSPYDNRTVDEATQRYQNCSNYLFICSSRNQTERCPIEGSDTNCHSLQISSDYNNSHAHDIFDTVTKQLSIENRSEFDLAFMSNTEVVFQVTVIGEKISDHDQVIIAAVILVFVYVLIGFDIVHRTLAAFIGSTCTIGVLSMLGKRPTLIEVVDWIDLDTICLLFGMMVLVGIFSKTGFFDYSAVKAYKLARGRPGLLIAILCLFSAVVSAFLDNVTTILLLTPVSIRLCQVLNLDPRPVLIAEVIFSNIGGTATAVGDPPNVIIVSNKLIKAAGINFTEFTLHLFLGIIFCIATAYLLLFAIYYFQFVRVKNKDPPHISELKREIAIWERTAQRLNVVSLEERAVRDALISKAAEVRSQLGLEQDTTMQSSQDMWKKNLAELESKYCITDYILLTKSSIVLLFVILLFFLSNVIPNIELELGWIAVFGAVVLLILSDIQDLEAILHKIEWGTLLFFGGLFVLMEGLGELGLIRFIGDVMILIVEHVPARYQMLVAIVIVLWISALASSFIDNIPFTTATIPVIVELANSDKLCLSLKPLVWALAFGACLGGNGTLIGASANVVAAGIAEQNGYKISFVKFLIIGFPMMLATTFTAGIYLIICHEAIHWNTQDARECVAKLA